MPQLLALRAASPADGTGTDNDSSQHSSSGSGGGLGAGAIIVIVLIVLLVVAGVAYVVHTQLRARRLGLPAPTWRHYVPFVSSNPRSQAASYEPSRGGIFNNLKNRFSSAGSGGGGGGRSYTGRGLRSANTRNNMADPDYAWDHRIAEEEEELEYLGAAGARGGGSEVGAAGAVGGAGGAGGVGGAAERGRAGAPGVGPYASQGRSYPGETVRAVNPFDGDLGGRTYTPPPRRPSGESERRSVFRESIT